MNILEAKRFTFTQSLRARNTRPMSEEKQNSKFKFKKSAKHRAMDLLAQREHSEKELKLKLIRSKYEYTKEEVNEALEYVKKNNWLGSPILVAEKMANSLHKKNKGIQYINAYLRDKGLPSISMDPELELEKAQKLIKNKYSITNKNIAPEERKKIQAKAMRFLASRGFSSETIRKALYEKF